MHMGSNQLLDPEATKNMKKIIELLSGLHVAAWLLSMPFLLPVIEDWVDRTQIHNGYFGIMVFAVMYGACMAVLLFISLIAYVSANGTECMNKHKGTMKRLAVFSAISIVYLIFIFLIFFTMKGML